MKVHCGLLDEQPEKSRTLTLLRRGWWHLGLPEDLERELRTWLATPGFSIAYHAHQFKLSHGVIVRHYYDHTPEYQSLGLENFQSVTREDAVRLCRMRPGTGNIPFVCQLRMMDDLKAQMRKVDVARDYQVNYQTVRNLGAGLIKCQAPLPPALSQLLQTHSS